MLTQKDIEIGICMFQRRAETDLDFCMELFEWTSIRLMAAKYAYYILNEQWCSDTAYDIMEKNWYVMGRGLSLIREDETSPCIDFDHNAAYAEPARWLALYYLGKDKQTCLKWDIIKKNLGYV